MDPTGAGRTRGFRASDPEPIAASPPLPTAVPSSDPASSGTAETLDVGGPPRPRRTLFGRRPPGRPRAYAAVALGLLALVLVAALAFRLGSASTPSSQDTPTPTPSGAKTPTALPVPDLYTQVLPSVVLVTTSKGSLGSGTVVTDTGVVLTAHHVIAGGGRITLTFADGTRSAATVATDNPKNDTATLTPKKLPEVVVPAVLGGAVAVGSDVVAIGNPLGLRASTSTGIVSGLGRRTTTKTGSVSGLIQFDAAVNPGSSGGPLFDARGAVIGVVVSIADPGKDEAFAGIGFAVPIGTALGGGDGDGPGGGPRL